MSVQTFTKSGAKAQAGVTLPKDIFGEEVKSHDLLHQAFVYGHAARRANSAHVLARGEVRGGGRKPWKQKGTGRARHGSIRSPIWRGGGVTFGPTKERDYSKTLPANAKRKSVRQALTLLNKEGNLSVIDSFELKDAKTKSAVNLLDKMKLKVPLLIVVDKKTDEVSRATRNLQDVNLITARYLSVFSLINATHVLVTKPALDSLKDWLPAKTATKRGDK